MPGTKEAPNYNSLRVRRAQKINTIEGMRLKKRVVLMDKERIGHINLANRDIRRLNNQLTYIHHSSGVSPLGLAPDESYELPGEKPTIFQYGERVGSRRVGRSRKTSILAQERLSARRNTDTDSAVVLSLESNQQGYSSEEVASIDSDIEDFTERKIEADRRPVSSPGQRLSNEWNMAKTADSSINAFANGLLNTRRESVITPAESMARRGLGPRGSTKSAWSKIKSDLNIPQRPFSSYIKTGSANSSSSELRRTKSSQVLSPDACTRIDFNSNLENAAYENNNDYDINNESEQSPRTRSRSRRPAVHARKSEFTILVNQARATATVMKKMKHESNQTDNAFKETYAETKAKNTIERKKKINTGRAAKVECKIVEYKKKYPVVNLNDIKSNGIIL
ncbi:unnamed protein product [Owenia fusiformis]|uniref:Uncharacterized protein n=1 Tax=Owenia fusiformis TaxID=6347 RepID=A0A8S4Q5M9_OWEFU|nr:unnamed protein product [Owenia fusiformis]